MLGELTMYRTHDGGVQDEGEGRKQCHGAHGLRDSVGAIREHLGKRELGGALQVEENRDTLPSLWDYRIDSGEISKESRGVMVSLAVTGKDGRATMCQV